MIWHYNIVKDGNGFGIREIYVDDPNQEEPLFPGQEFGWTSSRSEPHGDTREELLQDLKMMLNDAKKYPVIELTAEVLKKN